MQSRITALCCACAALWLTPAGAQQSADSGPADPRAAVPAAPYQSAFTAYRGYRDEKPASWRALNDEAARIGGHIGIFTGGTHTGHGAPVRATPPGEPQGGAK